MLKEIAISDAYAAGFEFSNKMKTQITITFHATCRMTYMVLRRNIRMIPKCLLLSPNCY